MHIYEVHISKIIIHQLDGLLETNRLPVGLLAQLVERCTGIAKVMVQIPYGPEFFFKILFSTICFSSVLSCEDLLVSSPHRSANI